jgi:hypothetical protein
MCSKYYTGYIFLCTKLELKEENTKTIKVLFSYGQKWELTLKYWALNVHSTMHVNENMPGTVSTLDANSNKYSSNPYNLEKGITPINTLTIFP